MITISPDGFNRINSSDDFFHLMYSYPYNSGYGSFKFYFEFYVSFVYYFYIRSIYIKLENSNLYD